MTGGPVGMFGVSEQDSVEGSYRSHLTTATSSVSGARITDVYSFFRHYSPSVSLRLSEWQVCLR